VNTSLQTSTTTQRNSSLATLFTTLASGHHAVLWFVKTMANVWPYTKRTAMYVSAKLDSQEEIVKPVRLFPMAVILGLYDESENCWLVNFFVRVRVLGLGLALDEGRHGFRILRMVWRKERKGNVVCWTQQGDDYLPRQHNETLWHNAAFMITKEVSLPARLRGDRDD